jgi:hypothetical protein
MSLTISRYKGGRNWAVREADTGSLVVVTVYRKGAVEVVRRLTGAIPDLPRRKRQRDFIYEAKSSQEVVS